MSTEAPSNPNHPPAVTDDSIAKHQCIVFNSNPSLSPASTIVALIKKLSPLEGAMTTVVPPYVQTLRSKLKPYFSKIIKSLFQAYST